MTDRAQPGAIKSLARNDELAQVLGQLTGGFDDGWVADPADPTAASTRRSDINESAFDGFALSNVSASSLSVDVGPGEAFAGGWFARDTSTTVSLPANMTSTIVAAMDVDAVYDPQNDPDRDAADRVIIDIAANISDDLPRVRLHEATTDGSGVTGTTDLRKPYGPALKANTITDGADVSHTAELADLADVFSGSHTDLSNITSDQHHAQDHATRHSEGGSDAVTVENLAASSTDTSLAFKPDGNGGVQAGGVGNLSLSDLVDETSNRSSGTDFTNNTGGPLEVIITINGSSNSVDAGLETTAFAEELDLVDSFDAAKGAVAGMVQDGETYRLDLNTGSINTWLERTLSIS